MVIICCICCFFCLRTKKNKEKQTANARKKGQQNSLKPAETNPEIPVTPVHKINQVDVEALDSPARKKYLQKDHQRYSAIDRKIYKR